MANHQAIAAVCESVINLLRARYRPEDFGRIELDFRVYGRQDFAAPMQAGVSLFLYEVTVDRVNRNPAGRVAGSGGRSASLLPLELHFFLSVWAKDPSLAHSIAGWMMRCLEDTPLLPAGLLNATWPEVFRPEETVEILAGELSVQDMATIWERLSERGLALSVPYIARGLRIDSTRAPGGGVPGGQRAGDREAGGGVP